ncbi:type II toxin-antitoxin system RelE/ParE family toxin [Candidatus Poriferisodalis multihospitum]|uniref:type II toxin-antitoxin system RelE family toxin n=1 Tax=Candidatus Poriferisodalis multihospitum TaxID=2983191 RepID=UPI002B263689|nr:type II toxin-antitoxin system RelE/ParE family toxin [Candidatus Poriferisodalis multihospitum]
MYAVQFTAASKRHLDRLPEGVRAAALATINGPIRENPLRAGKPLSRSLSGHRSARRGDYRIVYKVNDDASVVVIHRVQHRRDVYRLV